ncbi:MAG: hypothetical protein KAI66_00080, partial [Lentisphaeria bacterium]|nr:hypothetical protein [Lentisphaeria bacterium]
DRWRLAPGAGRVLVDGAVATPGTEIEPASWIVLEYKHCAVAIRALACRVPTEGSNDENPQRRTRGGIAELPVRVSADERGAYLAVELVSRSTGTLTEHLLFSGWCVVLLDRPEDVDSLQIDESFREDGELPRTYGELVRTVTLTTPAVALTIERDMLTWETRRHINGSPLEPQIG